MERSFIANTMLALAFTLTTWILWSLGESRVDAYTSLYALEYTLIKAIIRPRRLTIDIPWILLLALFTIAVVYRVGEVLGLWRELPF